MWPLHHPYCQSLYRLNALSSISGEIHLIDDLKRKDLVGHLSFHPEERINSLKTRKMPPKR